jgi:hypothetical protein
MCARLDLAIYLLAFTMEILPIHRVAELLAQPWLPKLEKNGKKQKELKRNTRMETSSTQKKCYIIAEPL